MIELIAEAASNHGGDRGLMEAFIAEYAAVGADWVKFQSYQVKTLRPNDPQREWLAKAELSDDDHFFLMEMCARYKVKFLTTAFHESRVPFLLNLGLDTLKIGSGEALNAPLARALWRRPRRVLVSLGLAKSPMGSYFGARDGAEFLHCVSRYPSPSELARANYIGMPYDHPAIVGYSDHSIGLDGCHIAIECGARLIEKHVALLEQKRPMRSWEATLEQFKELRAFADDDPQVYASRWQYEAT